MPSAALEVAGQAWTGGTVPWPGWLVLSALASGIVSMWLYARLEPRKHIRPVQRLAARVQRQMQSYDGDFSGGMALAGKNLALAGRRLWLSLLPALASAVPVIVVMAVVLPAFDGDVLAVGPAWLRSATASFCLLTCCSALATKILLKTA
jgi:hypothetical protein